MSERKHVQTHSCGAWHGKYDSGRAGVDPTLGDLDKQLLDRSARVEEFLNT